MLDRVAPDFALCYTALALMAFAQGLGICLPLRCSRLHGLLRKWMSKPCLRIHVQDAVSLCGKAG